MDFFNSSADLTLALLSFSQQEDLCQGSEVSRSCDVARLRPGKGLIPQCLLEGSLGVAGRAYFVV